MICWFIYVGHACQPFPTIIKNWPPTAPVSKASTIFPLVRKVEERPLVDNVWRLQVTWPSFHIRRGKWLRRIFWFYFYVYQSDFLDTYNLQPMKDGEELIIMISALMQWFQKDTTSGSTMPARTACPWGHHCQIEVELVPLSLHHLIKIQSSEQESLISQAGSCVPALAVRFRRPNICPDTYAPEWEKKS